MLSVFFKDSIPFYAFYLITIFWILEFIYFPSKNKSSKKIEKKTFFRILLSILFTIFMNIIMLLSFDFFYNPLYLQIISLILYFFGLCLRLSSLFFLGSNFSRNLSINENQKLVSNGPFRYLRHPSYLGLYLLTICVPLFFGNLILFIFALIYMFYAIKKRIEIEEMLLEKMFGHEYIVWKKKRFIFIPFIY